MTSRGFSYEGEQRFSLLFSTPQNTRAYAMDNPQNTRDPARFLVLLVLIIAGFSFYGAINRISKAIDGHREMIGISKSIDRDMEITTCRNLGKTIGLLAVLEERLEKLEKRFAAKHPFLDANEKETPLDPPSDHRKKPGNLGSCLRVVDGALTPVDDDDR